MKQKITPFLWFDHQAEEAAQFYVSLFKDSEILEINRYGKAGPAPEGAVLTVKFKLEGQEFIALNGGPQFQFSEAVSFYVDCETQAEVDWLWERLTAQGEESMCGWLKDKYGLSWQIIPAGLMELLSNPEAEKSRRATEAMFQMKKIDLEAIRQACETDAGAA
jgi:predicted 3-demethylubiquinone-9 3-methyltransferase (glyoxalase superfamily)